MPAAPPAASVYALGYARPTPTTPRASPSRPETPWQPLDTVYDLAGRLNRQRRSAQSPRHHYYDAAEPTGGGPESLRWVTTTSYDATGAVIATMTALQDVTTTLYETSGAIRDARRPQLSHDGRLRRVLAGSRPISITWLSQHELFDALGRAAAMQDPLGYVTRPVR